MLTDEVKKKIEEILERTCGFECSNGAEENKPALPELLALFESVLKKQEIKIRREATVDTYKFFLEKIVEGENHFPNNKDFVIEVNTKEIKEWLEKVITLTKH